MSGRAPSRVLRLLALSGVMAACLMGFAVAGRAQQAALSAASAARGQLRQALALAESGNEAQALSLTNSLVASYPSFAPGFKLQGELLEDAGRQQAAADAYERALALAPNDPDMLLKVGVIQLVTGHYDQSIALLEHRLRLIPHDRDALYYLAQAYHLKGKNKLALQAIAECARVAPGNGSVQQKYGELLSGTGDNEDAMPWLLEAEHTDPTLPRIDYDLAVASYNNMDFTDALKYAEKAVSRRPGDAEALALDAAVEVKLAQWQDAEAVFKKILVLKPGDTASLLGLGRCQMELKQYPEAIGNLEQVAQADPTRVLAHFYLARAYAGLGETAQAQREQRLYATMLQQVTAHPPGEDIQRENAVWKQARQLLVEHHEEQARQLFEKSSSGPAAVPGNSYVLVGALYLSMGQMRDAARNLHQALVVNPKVRGAYTYLGAIALEQDDLVRAEQEFDKELNLHPNDLAAVAGIGEVRYRQGNWAEAARKLAQSESTDPARLYMLCDSYFRLGQIQKAETTAYALADYAHRNPQVMQGLIALAERNGDTALAQRLKQGTTP